MQQRVILHSEQISRSGEIKYFQIPLQGTAIRIIAVEASAFLFSPPPAQPPVVPSPPAPTPAPMPVPAPQPSASCPNPGSATMEPVSDVVSGPIRTQSFRIGPAVNPSFEYRIGVYSHVITVVAQSGDTPETIALQFAQRVNNTSLAEWSQYGSNNHQYRPTGQINRDVITVTIDYQHSFFASATGSCGLEPPPPPPPQPQLLDYDPLFRIVRNERAGLLSLQSPDVTDIFMQCEAWRLDGNTGFGDYTFPGDGGEWLRGKRRLASEVNLTTASPILEAYYKDSWGLYHGKDLSYGLNIFIWFEKLAA